MVFNGSIGALQALGAGSNPVRCSINLYGALVELVKTPLSQGVRLWVRIP